MAPTRIAAPMVVTMVPTEALPGSAAIIWTKNPPDWARMPTTSAAQARCLIGAE
jgi:hypothetical protein